MAVMIYVRLYTSFFDLIIQCIFCILSNPSTRIRMSAAVPFLRAVWKSARYSARLPHFDNMRQMRARVTSLYSNIDFINWYSYRKKIALSMALIGGHSDLNINLPNNFPCQITSPGLSILKSRCYSVVAHLWKESWLGVMRMVSSHTNLAKGHSCHEARL